MAWRTSYILIGLLLLIVVTTLTTNAYWLGSLLAWVLIALASEVVSLIRGLLAGSGPRDLSPPDGEVGLVWVPGFEIKPNEVDPRVGLLVQPVVISPLALAEEAAPVVPLLGKVVIITIFIGRDDASWTDTEIAGCLGSVVTAGRWIEAEAIRWGVPLNLELATAYLVGDDASERPTELALGSDGQVDDTSVEATRRMIRSIMQVLHPVGFDRPSELLEVVKQRLGADAVVGLVHPRSAGRSFVYSHNLSEVRLAAGLAICYPRYADHDTTLTRKPPATDPTTIAHELLHLFDATDKYDVPLSRFAKREVTRRDIMRLERNTLSHLRIDQLTAREIGWAGARTLVEPKKTPLAPGNGPKGEGCNVG